jgi:adenylate kinase
MLKKRLMMLGAPLSGKGTQSMWISKECGLHYLSTGAMFRAAIAEGNELGKKVEQTINEGRLVSDEITNAVVDQELSKINLSNGFILDGYPRDVEQAEALDHMLSSRGQKLDAVIYMNVHDEMLIERQKARIVCSKCGASYNNTDLRPKVEGVCDRCQTPNLVRRKDDNEESIRRRLESYHEATLPLLGFYQEKGILLKVDGEKDAESVRKDIMEGISR